MIMEEAETVMKSGFETNPIGFTGIVCRGKNPATGDPFWQCRIIDAVDDDKFRVELEDGQIGIIERSEFTPAYFKRSEK